MEAITVSTEGDVQVIRLPKSIHLNSDSVNVRQEGESVILEPVKDSGWPEGFWDEIHIKDPNFGLLDQGELPPIIDL